MFKLNEKQISAIKDFLKKSIEVLLLVIITLVSFSIKYGIIIIKIIVKNAIIFTKVFVYYFIEGTKFLNNIFNSGMNLVYNTLGKIPFTEKIPTIFKSISKMVTTFLSKMVTIIVLSVYLTSIFAPTYYAHMHNKYELALNTYHIWQGNRADAKLQAKKKVLKDEYDTMLKQEIFVKLGEILDLKKEQCINREVTDFLYSYAQETGEAPPSEIISMARAQADFSTCSVTNLKSDVYENLVKIPFEKEFSVSFDELEKARKYDEDTQYAQQKKALADEQKAAEDAAKAIDIDKLAETHATGPIKAVFCSYGHGMGDNGWTDNGARADDGTTERSLIMPVVGDACDKISTGLKNKGVKVYRIGEKPMTLVDKIAQINKISEENGYDATNSIMFELHWNKVPEASRSGMMVFFSQLKMAEDGLQGEALAARVLKTLKKNNGVGNYYTVMNDKYSRFGGLGIVSRTKPNSVLIEYGFLSNAKDLEFSKKNPGRIAKDIADAFIGFVGDEEKKVAKK